MAVRTGSTARGARGRGPGMKRIDAAPPRNWVPSTLFAAIAIALAAAYAACSKTPEPSPQPATNRSGDSPKQEPQPTAVQTAAQPSTVASAPPGSGPADLAYDAPAAWTSVTN